MLSKKDLSHSARVGNYKSKGVHSVKDLVQKNIIKPLHIAHKNFHFPYRKEEVNKPVLQTKLKK